MKRFSTGSASSDRADAQRRLAEFRRGKTAERLFVQSTCHPSEPTGFCFCDGSPWRAILFYARAALLDLVFRLPFNGLKVRALRRMGARVGNPVYFSHGVWIDPMFPELLTIEDHVFFGMGTRIFTHEFRIDRFRAGKVVIRRGSFIGGFSVIRCGVEIGENSVVDGGCMVQHDVPAGATLKAPPAQLMQAAK